MPDETVEVRRRVVELEKIVEAQRREIAELKRRIEDMGELIKLARSQAEPPEGRH